MSRLVVRGSACLFLLALVATSARAADAVDLTHATVVIRGGNLPAAEKIAPEILTEEIAKRSASRGRSSHVGRHPEQTQP